MKRITLALVVAGVVSVFSGVGLAGTFVGNSGGVFQTPSGAPGDPIVYSGVGTNFIQTGTGVNGSPPNSLRYTGVGFDTNADLPFRVGILDYYNGATAVGSSATNLPIDITLTFSAPPGLPNQVFNFSFNLTLTNNTTGDPVLDGDIITFPSGFSSTSFSTGGQDYTLKLLGFSKDGGASILSSFLLPENQSARSDLYATITTEQNPNVVPLPIAAIAGLPLLGFVVGVRQLRQRRQGE